MLLERRTCLMLVKPLVDEVDNFEPSVSCKAQRLLKIQHCGSFLVYPEDQHGMGVLLQVSMDAGAWSIESDLLPSATWKKGGCTSCMSRVFVPALYSSMEHTHKYIAYTYSLTFEGTFSWFLCIFKTRKLFLILLGFSNDYFFTEVGSWGEDCK